MMISTCPSLARFISRSRPYLALLAVAFVLGAHPPSATASQPAPAGLVPEQTALYLPLLARSAPLAVPIGPDGGSIVALAAEPGESGKVYAGTWGGGVYKSLDRGQTWRSASQGLTNLYIQSLLVDPLRPGVVYAGTYLSGVFKSIDGGDSWAPTGPGMNDAETGTPQAVVYSMVIDPHNTDILYAGARGPDQIDGQWGGGVFKSTDGGDSWQKSNHGLLEDWVYDLAIDPLSPNTLFAATHTKGIFVTSDGAASWSIRNPGLTDWSTRSLVIDPFDPARILLGTWHGGGIFLTLNDGINWKYAGLAQQKIYALSGDAFDAQIAYAVTYPSGFFRSSDSGNSWGFVRWSNQWLYTILSDPTRPGMIYLGSHAAGLYQSLDRGESWFHSQAGLRASQATAIAVDWNPASGAAATIYAGVNGAGVFKTTVQTAASLGDSSPGESAEKDHPIAADGLTWEAINAGLADVQITALTLSPQSPQRLFAGTTSGGVYCSTDGGATWSTVNTGLPRTDPEAALFDALALRREFYSAAPPELWDAPSRSVDAKIILINALHVDAFNPQALYAGVGKKGLYRSLNGGTSWQATGLTTRPIYVVANDPFDPALLYAGSDQTLPFEDGANTLFKSQDGGATWQVINAGIADLTVYAIAPDPLSPGVLFIGTNWGVYRSPDYGASWEAVGSGSLAGIPVAALAFSQDDNPAAPAKLFAGSAVGLFLSEDGGLSWRKIDAGMLCPEIRTLALSPAGSSFDLVGTHACGIYQLYK